MSKSELARVMRFVNIVAHSSWFYEEDDCVYLMTCPENRQILARFLREKLTEDEALAILKYFFGGFEIGEVECPFEGKKLATVARKAAKKVDFTFVYLLLVVRPGEARQRLEQISSLMMREDLKHCMEDLMEAYYICEYFLECNNELAARFSTIRDMVSAVLDQMQNVTDLLNE